MSSPDLPNATAPETNGPGAVRIFRGKRLMQAGALNERHMGRLVRIGDVEGQLIGLMTSQVRVDVVLIVGGARAIFPLAPDAAVEVGPKHTKENP